MKTHRRSVKISGNMHNKFLHQLRRTTRYTNRATISLVGLNKDDIIVDSVILPRDDNAGPSCDQMPSIPTRSFVKGMTTLYKKGLTPGGITRVKKGLGTSRFGERRGGGLYRLSNMSRDAYCITYTDNRIIVDSAQRNFNYKVVPIKGKEVKKNGKNKSTARTDVKTIVRKKHRRGVNTQRLPRKKQT